MTSQDEVVAFLKRAELYPGAERVEEIQTHGAHVFLGGDAALKIKRAVRYDYLDYSTLARRESALRRELELNAPAAPRLYRDVVPVTREADGHLALNGAGEAVEWVLRMARFPDSAQLDRVAARGDLDRTLAETLGDSIARYHAAATPHQGAGGVWRMVDILDELEREFTGMGDALPEAQIARFLSGARSALARVRALLDARAAAGYVRRCHGDLHLRNIVMLDGVPVPFDALEFSEELGTCDVLYDLAFLLMDLRHRALGAAANTVFNRFLFATGEEDHYAGLAALPLFQAVRAAISAMVAVQTAQAQAADGPLADARRYLADACAVLEPVPPRLVAVGGLSGTGKTTLARGLAPVLGVAPGAVHLRSDMIRKALCGVDPLMPLGPEGYAPQITTQVYDRMKHLARLVLDAGQAVVVDAVYLSEPERAGIAQAAASCGTDFAGLWLEADPDVLLGRVERRERDASDADSAVVRMQLSHEAGQVEWLTLDAGGAPEQTLSDACDALGVARAP